MKRILLATLAAALLLGACGDDGGSGSSSASVTKVKESLTQDDDGFALEDGDAECVAKKIVSSLGDKRIDEIDFDADTPAFTDKEAKTVADAFKSCTDLSELFAASLSASSELSDDSVACVAKTADDNAIRDLLAVTYSETGEVTEQVVEPIDKVLQECLTAEEYETVS